LRILLIAPDQPGINSDPEVRDITAMHTVNVIAGNVSARDLYNVCQYNEFDVIHIIDHNEEGSDRSVVSKIPLSNGDSLDAQDVVELAQACEARGVFLNTCNSSFYAAYAVRRGIGFAIFTTLNIADSSAWKAPLVFYSALQQQEKAASLDFYQAYLSLPDGGVYGWTSSRADYQAYLLSPVMKRFDDIVSQIKDLQVGVTGLEASRKEDLTGVQENLQERIQEEIKRIRKSDLLWLAVALFVILVVSIIGDVVMWNAIRGLAAGA